MDELINTANVTAKVNLIRVKSDILVRSGLKSMYGHNQSHPNEQMLHLSKLLFSSVCVVFAWKRTKVLCVFSAPSDMLT